MTSRVETEGQSRAATRSGFQVNDRSFCLEDRYDARRNEISVLELGSRVFQTFITNSDETGAISF